MVLQACVTLQAAITNPTLLTLCIPLILSPTHQIHHLSAHLSGCVRFFNKMAISSPFPGSVTELFKFQCAAIILMDYNKEEETRFLRLGQFMVKMMIQSMEMTPNILTCVCMVGDLQWPLAKDSAVIRVGQRTFAFAMSGLLYGVQFPPTCDSDLIHSLLAVFRKFGYYKDINENGLTGYPYPDNEPHLWQKLRGRIELVAHSTLSKLGYNPGSSPASMATKSSDLLKAIRLSATTKMISNAIIFQTLDSNFIHIQKEKGRSSVKPINKSERNKRGLMIDTQPAYSSITVFTGLVEAVEIAWAVAAGFGGRLKEWPQAEMPKGWRGAKSWRLNRLGVIAFLEGLRPIVEVEERNVNESFGEEMDVIKHSCE